MQTTANNASTTSKVNNSSNTTNVASANNTKAAAKQLSAKRISAINARVISNATQRTQIAQMFLLQRAKLNKARIAKQSSNSSSYTAKTARYNSIFANVKCMHTLAAMCILHKCTQQQTAAYFIQAYALKNVTNLQFIAQRMQVYLTHSKTLAILNKLQQQQAAATK